MTGKFLPLSDDDLKRVFDKFVEGRYRVVCTENHIHGFNCLDFSDEQAMMMERLRVEVCLLRGKLKEIEDVVKR